MRPNPFLPCLPLPSLQSARSTSSLLLVCHVQTRNILFYGIAGEPWLWGSLRGLDVRGTTRPLLLFLLGKGERGALEIGFLVFSVRVWRSPAFDLVLGIREMKPTVCPLSLVCVCGSLSSSHAAVWSCSLVLFIPVVFQCVFLHYGMMLIIVYCTC